MFQQGNNPFAVPLAGIGMGQTQFNLPAPKAQGGMFGGGDWKSALAAALAGFSAGGGNPAGQMALQAIHGNRLQKQRQELEEQQYQRQRSDGMQDWMAKQKWELENRQPDYDAFQKHLIEGGVRPGTPEWVAAHKRKSEFEQNPMVMTAYGPMPYSAVAGQQQQQALPPVLSDSDFGVQGGPTPQASGGFPGPY